MLSQRSLQASPVPGLKWQGLLESLERPFQCPNVSHAPRATAPAARKPWPPSSSQQPEKPAERRPPAFHSACSPMNRFHQVHGLPPFLSPPAVDEHGLRCWLAPTPAL